MRQDRLTPLRLIVIQGSAESEGVSATGSPAGRLGEVDVHTLRGVTVDLYEGEFVVLLGPSGSGALDSATGGVVLEAVERVNHELGTTTVVITHNAVIAGIADRVISLADGRIASDIRNAHRLSARGVSG